MNQNDDAPFTARHRAELRYSVALKSADAWKGIVIDDTLADTGMASFASVLDEKDGEAFRAFVIAQAHATARK